MVSDGIPFYVALCWLSMIPEYYAKEAQTGVCIKRSHIKEYPISGGTFPDVVRENTIFVDKSLLIKAIVEAEKKVILITCPRRWGKSINMQMMKTFFEVGVDSDGKKIPSKETSKYIFYTVGNVSFDDMTSFSKKYHVDHLTDLQVYEKPPLISKYKAFVDEYLGNYPAIYFDWSVISWDVGDYDSFFKELKYAICDFFTDNYSYLKEVLAEAAKSDRFNAPAKELILNDLHKLRKILNIRFDGQISELELENSFHLLSKILYEHYGNPVFIFMDEWANPLVDVFHHFSNDDGRNRIVKFFAYFTRETFKENRYLKKAVLTGVLSVGNDELFDDFADMVAHHNVSHNHFAEFYGLTSGEIRSLFKYYDIADEELKNAMISYDGYKMTRASNMTVCNIWSLIDFFNKKEFVNYWVDTGDLEALKKWLDIDKFKKVWESLINGGHVAIEYMDMKLEYKGYLIEINKIWGKNEPTDDKAMNFVFSYLFDTGYLTISDAPLGNDTFGNPRAINLRAPNNEVKKYMKGQLFPEKNVTLSSENLKSFKDEY